MSSLFTLLLCVTLQCLVGNSLIHYPTRTRRYHALTLTGARLGLRERGLGLALVSRPPLAVAASRPRSAPSHWPPDRRLCRPPGTSGGEGEPGPSLSVSPSRERLLPRAALAPLPARLVLALVRHVRVRRRPAGSSGRGLQAEC